MLPIGSQERAKLMQIAVVGIDLGKNICSLAGLTELPEEKRSPCNPASIHGIAA
jgi:hypothetical protein